MRLINPAVFLARVQLDLIGKGEDRAVRVAHRVDQRQVELQAHNLLVRRILKGPSDDIRIEWHLPHLVNSDGAILRHGWKREGEDESYDQCFH